MRGNSHVRCGVGENLEITSKDYLSLSGAKSQGVKQLKAGKGRANEMTKSPLKTSLYNLKCYFKGAF